MSLLKLILVLEEQITVLLEVSVEDRGCSLEVVQFQVAPEEEALHLSIFNFVLVLALLLQLFDPNLGIFFGYL